MARTCSARRFRLAIGRLESLTYLNLSDNRLRGSIPSELGNLAKLETLVLTGNNFSGSIPAELGGLSNLERL